MIFRVTIDLHFSTIFLSIVIIEMHLHNVSDEVRLIISGADIIILIHETNDQTSGVGQFNNMQRWYCFAGL